MDKRHIFSALLNHSSIEICAKMIRELPGWPGEAAQADLVEACLHHTRNFPLSIKYTKAIIKLLERDCEGAMDDALTAFIINFYSSARIREAERGGEDRDQSGQCSLLSAQPLSQDSHRRVRCLRSCSVTES